MKSKTFWLARDNITRNWWDYSISNQKMGRIKTRESDMFLSSAETGYSSIQKSTVDLLGLPTLRKGQQVQIRRTNNGFEIVKGKKDGK